MVSVNRGPMLATILCFWAAWSPTAHADWAACQNKPTRACLLEEAMRGDNGPLVGKDRLDVLVLTDVLNHPEYATAEDIDEAARRAKTSSLSRYYYLYLAIKGLVAANRFQEAFDLVSNVEVGMRSAGFLALTRDLVKAGELDKAFVFGKQTPPPFNPTGVIPEAVKTLTDMGKIEEALAFIILNPIASRDVSADMLAAVGVAYAKRGDYQMATRFYDRAQVTLEEGGLPGAGDGYAMEFHFAQISLKALRGDMESVKAALQELLPVSGNQADGLKFNRFRGSQKLILALLQAKYFEVALDVAKSTPEPFRELNLMVVARQDAANGRLDEGRAILSSLGNQVDPRIRGPILRSLAVATAQAGNVTSAVALASQTSDAASRRAILFEVAHTLPQ